MSLLFIAERLALVTALAVFLGLAFEDMYKRDEHSLPGGIRTFPMLALAGSALYLTDPARALAYVAGLLVLGAWLYPYLSAARPSFIVPICHLAAYAMGPIALTQSPWVAVSMTVVTVLLMTGRTQIHRVVEVVPAEEVRTAGEFLVLVGIILPLVPNEPLIPQVPLTPFQAWLALVAVSATAYVTYFVQRYVPSRNSVLLPAVMGGFYSSTAITLVLAKRLRESDHGSSDLSAGIVGATAVMYVRIGVIVGLFDQHLALALLPALAGLFACGSALAIWEWMRKRANQPVAGISAQNPLQLTAAVIFAASYVAISVISSWVKTSFGAAGIIVLALPVGLTDIAPFVTTLAQGGSTSLTQGIVTAAILTAASSNNVLKAVYALAFGGRAAALAPAAMLTALAALGFVMAAVYGWEG
ncbi:MAG TPA: DUF4010 domain-containing protein [Alphaproteobacteria bacterium]|nr:DUF4010 domain-containing protein [Alphaproteobacteria bacterium]